MSDPRSGNGAAAGDGGFSQDVSRPRDLAAAALAGLGNLVAVLDTSGRIVLFNHECERVTGCAAADVLGRPLWDLFADPEDAAPFRSLFEHLVPELFPWASESRLCPCGGEPRLISWIFTCLEGEEGGIAHVIGAGIDVTERRWAEEDLLRSHQTLRTLIESSPLAVSVLDRDGLVRVWNPAAESTFGFTRREALGRPLLNVPEERSGELSAKLHQTLLGQGLGGVETVRKRKDGSLVDVQIWTALLRGPQDEPESMLVMTADIGDRKRAEEALRLREEQLRLLTDSVPVLISYVDAGHRYRFANRQYEIWLRRPAADLYGRPLGEVLGEAAYEKARPYIERALAGESVSFEAWLPYETGARYVHVTYEPHRGAGGEVQGLFALVTDLTDRKRAEEALRASEEEFRAIFELTGVGKAQIDAATGRFVRVNRKMCDITGYSSEELLRMSFQDLTHPDDRERERAQPEGPNGDWSIEKRYVRKDGAVVWVEIHASMIRDAAGRPLRSVAVIQDITDRKRAEETLRTAKEAVEAASRAKDHFLAVLSHELRTPLTPVLATVSVLEEDTTVRRDLRDALAMIRRNVELEARLIDDLLDLTRISHGKLELHRQIVDSQNLLVHAVNICCAQEVAAGRLRLEMGITPGDYRARADGSRLTQVFWNLLNNAVKFTPAGGSIRVRSSAEAGSTGRWIAVEISDTGIGIDPEILPRIFDAFEQADRRITRRYGGLGLGLAVSRAIVELHGGTLSAASEGRGRGSTFTVRFPAGELIDLDDTGAGFGDEPRAAEEGGRVDRPLRILLVEDHADTAEAMADLLRGMGHEVTVAGSVATALAAAEAAGGEGLDLLLSDLGLPDGSGLDIMRELARRYGLRGIALSGYGMEEDIRQSRDAGFDKHLTKPVSLQTLRAALQEAAASVGSPHA